MEDLTDLHVRLRRCIAFKPFTVESATEANSDSFRTRFVTIKRPFDVQKVTGYVQHGTAISTASVNCVKKNFCISPHKLAVVITRKFKIVNYQQFVKYRCIMYEVSQSAL